MDSKIAGLGRVGFQWRMGLPSGFGEPGGPDGSVERTDAGNPKVAYTRCSRCMVVWENTAIADMVD